jgi:hypothetical protein
MLFIVSFSRTTRKTTNIYEHYRHSDSPPFSQSQIGPIGYDTSGSKRILALPNPISQLGNSLYLGFPVPPLQTIVVQFLSPLSSQQYIGKWPAILPAVKIYQQNMLPNFVNFISLYPNAISVEWDFLSTLKPLHMHQLVKLSTDPELIGLA